MGTWLDFVQMLPRGRPSNPMSRAELVQALVGSLLGRLDLVARRSFPPADTVFNALVDHFKAVGALKPEENPKRPDGDVLMDQMGQSLSSHLVVVSVWVMSSVLGLMLGYVIALHIVIKTAPSNLGDDCPGQPCKDILAKWPSHL